MKSNMSWKERIPPQLAAGLVKMVEASVPILICIAAAIAAIVLLGIGLLPINECGYHVTSYTCAYWGPYA